MSDRFYWRLRWCARFSVVQVLAGVASTASDLPSAYALVALLIVLSHDRLGQRAGSIADCRV